MKKIKLTQGKYALVDDEDFEFLNQRKWQFHNNGRDRIGYAIRTGSDKSRIGMHRVLLGAKKGQIVDHINGNSLDNRKINLRLTDYRGNTRNKVGAIKRKHSQLKGAYKIVRAKVTSKAWASYIFASGKRYYLGHFHTDKEAYQAYAKAAKKYHGKFARWK